MSIANASYEEKEGSNTDTPCPKLPVIDSTVPDLLVLSNTLQNFAGSFRSVRVPRAQPHDRFHPPAQCLQHSNRVLHATTKSISSPSIMASIRIVFPIYQSFIYLILTKAQTNGTKSHNSLSFAPLSSSQ